MARRLGAILRTWHRMPRDLRAIVILVLLMFVLPVAFGAICSKLYWGYFFVRPDPIPEAAYAAQVDGMAALFEGRRKQGFIGFVRDEFREIENRYMFFSHPDEYYCLESRVLFHLDERNIAWDLAPELSDDLVAELNDAVEATGRVNATSTSLRGLAMMFPSDRGDTMYFVGVRSLEVSNDHYAYYEFLFERNNASELELDTFRHFYYDLAGVEGMEWYVMAGIAGGVIWPLLIIVTLVIAIIGLIKRLKRQCTMCVKCGYDLRGAHHEVCPECGSEITAADRAAIAAGDQGPF